MRLRTGVLSVVAAGVVCVPALRAQGVIVQSVSDVRLNGFLGGVVNLAARFGGGGGDMHSIPATTSIAGHRMRSESRDAATIFDADEGRITTLDLKAKTYWSMTFEQMAAAMQAAADSARAAAARAQAEQAKNPKSANAKGDVTVTYKVSFDRTGEHAKLLGYDVERVFLTLTAEGEAKPEGEASQQVGSLVFLFEQWLAKDAPQLAAMREFQKAYAQKMGQAFRPPMDALASVFSRDARIKAGFDESVKELQKLDGVSLKSISYVVLVPPDVPFNRALALGAAAADTAKPAEKKGRFGGLMGALKSAAEKSASSSSSSSNSEKNADPPKQSTLMTVSDSVTSIVKTDVPASVFVPPADFRAAARGRGR